MKKLSLFVVAIFIVSGNIPSFASQNYQITTITADAEITTVASFLVLFDSEVMTEAQIEIEAQEIVNTLPGSMSDNVKLTFPPGPAFVMTLRTTSIDAVELGIAIIETLGCGWSLVSSN